MNKFRVWLGIALIFLSGIVIGTLGSTFFIRKQMIGFMEGGPPRANRRIIMDITRGLDLSVRQNAQIDSILNENHLNIEKIAGEFHDTMESFLEKQSSQIKQVLTEEQQQEFDRRYEEIKKAIEDRVRHRRPGRGPGRGQRMHEERRYSPPPLPGDSI